MFPISQVLLQCSLYQEVIDLGQMIVIFSQSQTVLRTPPELNTDGFIMLPGRRCLGDVSGYLGDYDSLAECLIICKHHIPACVGFNLNVDSSNWPEYGRCGVW